MAHNAQYPVDEEKDEIVVLVVGKIGVGKSSLCNKLVGGTVFGEGDQLGAVTQECTMSFVQKQYAKKEQIKIVDTPGYLDTDKTPDKINRTILQFLSKKQGKVDILLVVFALSEEIIKYEIFEIENNLKEMFNNRIHDHIVNVFTHANDMIKVCGENTFSTYVKRMPSELQLYLARCDNRWIIIDNKSTEEQGYDEIIQRIVNLQSINKKDNNVLSLKNEHLQDIVAKKQKEINILLQENLEMKWLKEENLEQSKRIEKLENLNENLTARIKSLTEEKEAVESLLRKSKKGSKVCSLS